MVIKIHPPLSWELTITYIHVLVTCKNAKQQLKDCKSSCFWNNYIFVYLLKTIERIDRSRHIKADLILKLLLSKICRTAFVYWQMSQDTCVITKQTRSKETTEAKVATIQTIRFFHSKWHPITNAIRVTSLLLPPRQTI